MCGEFDAEGGDDGIPHRGVGAGVTFGNSVVRASFSARLANEFLGELGSGDDRLSGANKRLEPRMKGWGRQGVHEFVLTVLDLNAVRRRILAGSLTVLVKKLKIGGGVWDVDRGARGGRGGCGLALAGGNFLRKK